MCSRPTRRGRLETIFTATLTALALLLAACSSGSSSNSDSGNASNSRASQIVAAQVAEPKSLDPAADTAANDFRILVNLYDGLVGYAPHSLKIVPKLAKSWKTTHGGTVYIFKLRHGVQFADGTPVNAKAIKFNFDRMLVKGAPGSKTGPFPLADQFFGEVKQVSAVGPETVRFTLKKPYAPFLSNLAYPTGLIVSPTAVKKYGKNFGHHPVGSGAFTFNSWEKNQKVVLKANKKYWGGTAKTKTLVFRPLKDDSARISALKSHDVDVAEDIPADNVKSLENTPGIKVQKQPGPAIWYVILNTKSRPFKNKLVRRAANYAINKKTIAKSILQNTATVLKGPIATAFKDDYNSSLTGFPYNLKKAKKLMKKAGYSNGADATFYIPSSGSGMLEPKAMGEAIQSDLSKIGLHVHIKTFEWNTYLDKVNAGLKNKADMAEMSWTVNDANQVPYLTLRTAAFPGKKGFNSGYYSDKAVDNLINKAQRTTDPDARAKILKKMQKRVVPDAPWLFVANETFTVGMTDHLKGFHVHPSFDLYFDHAYIQK